MLEIGLKSPAEDGRTNYGGYRWNSVADKLFGGIERRTVRCSVAELSDEADADRHAVVSISMSANCVPSSTLIHVAILINQKVVANICPAWIKESQMTKLSEFCASTTVLAIVVH